MSNSVDQRIVEMRFENEQFERGIAQTSSSLEEFKKELDFGKIEDTLDQVSDKFSVFGTIADQMLRTVADGFMDLLGTAGSLVKSLSFDQVAAGFDKYAQKTSAVQLIMNATGLTAEEVNQKLQKLIWFSDETSYSFNDMVDSIGQFVATGMDIDTAITSIIGVADAAGYAAVGVEKASHAMVGFQKAMSKGYMDRMAYSWLRTSGMNQMEFKRRMLQAAEEIGTIRWDAEAQAYQVLTQMSNREPGFVTAEDFESELANGWLNKDVMARGLSYFGDYTETLYEYVNETGMLASDALDILDDLGDGIGKAAFRASQEAKTFQEAIDSVKDAVSSKWMTTFEYIFGNKDESVELWTFVANELWDVFAAGGEARNEMMALWKEMGGRDTLMQGFLNLWSSFKMVLQSVKDALHDLFPPITADRLFELTKRFEDWSWSIKMGVAKNLPKITNTLKGLFSIVKIGGKFLDALLIRPIKALFGIAGDTSTAVLSLTSEIGKLLTKVANSEILTAVLDKISDGLVAIISVVRAVLNAFFNLFKIRDFLSGVSSVVDFLTSPIRALVDAFGELTGIDVSGFQDKLTNAFEKVKTFVNDAKTAIVDFFTMLSDKTAFSRATWLTGMQENVFSGKAFQNFGGGVAGGYNVFGESSIRTFQLLLQMFENITGIQRPEWLDNFVVSLWDAHFAITQVIKDIQDFVKAIPDKLDTPWGNYKDALSEIFGGVNYYEAGGGFAGVLSSINFSGIATVDFVIEAFGALAGIDTTEVANNVHDSLVSIALSIENFVGSSEKLQKVGEFFSGFWEAIKQTFTNIKEYFFGVGDNEEEGFHSILSPWEMFTARLKQVFQPLANFWNNVIVPIWDSIKNFYNENIKPEIDRIKEGLLGEDGKVNIGTLLKGGGIVAVLLFLANKVADIFERFSALKGGGNSTLGAVIEAVFNPISEVLTKLKDFISAETVKEVANSILKMVAAIVILSFIPIDKLTAASGVLVSFFAEITWILKTLSSIFSIQGNPAEFAKSTASIITLGRLVSKIASSILLMSIAVAIISAQDSTRATEAIINISELLGIMILFLVGLKNTVTQLTPQQLTAVGGLMMEMAATLIIIALALKLVSSFTYEEGWQGGTALLAVITTFVGVIAALQRIKIAPAQLMAIGSSFILMATSLTIIAGALALVSFFNWDEYGAGLLALNLTVTNLASVLFLLAKTSSSATQMLSAGVALFTAAQALLLIGLAFKQVSELGWDDMWVAFVAINGTVAILGGVLAALSNVGGGPAKVMTSAAAFLVMALAIDALTPALLALSKIEFGALMGGVAAISAMLLAFTVAGAIAQKVAPGILVLSAGVAILATSFLIFATGVAVFGAGLVTLAAGISALVLIGKPAVDLFMYFLEEAAKRLPQIKALITGIIVAIGEGVGTFLLITLPTLFLESIPAMTEALVNGILMLCDVFIQTLPTVLDTLMTFITSLLDAIVENLPTIIDNLITLLIYVLDGLTARINEVITSLINLICAAILGVTSNLGTIISTLIQMVIDLLEGIAQAINDKAEALANAIMDVVEAFVMALITFFETFTKRFIALGEKLFGKDDGLLKGVTNKITEGKKKVTEFFDNIKKAINNIIGDFVQIGKNVISGIVTGLEKARDWIKNKLNEILGGTLAFVEKLLGIASPSKVFMKYGMYVDEGFAVGLDKYAGVVKDSTEDLGDTAIDGIKDSMSRLSEIIDADEDFTPVITPVIDLDNVESGMTKLSGMMQNQQYAIDAVSSFKNSDNYIGKMLDEMDRHNRFEESKTPISEINVYINGVDNDNVEDLADIVVNRINHEILRGKAAFA